MSAIDKLLIRKYQAKVTPREAVQETFLEKTESAEAPQSKPPQLAERNEADVADSQPAQKPDARPADQSDAHVPDTNVPDTNVPDTVYTPQQQQANTPTAPEACDSHVAGEIGEIDIERPLEMPIVDANHEGPAHPNSQVNEPPADFAPQWEVDSFQWPKLCSDLTDRIQPELEAVVGKLVEKCGHGKNVLLMTSHARGEGRTTISLSLARQAGPSGLKVALVDGDLTKPELSQRLGVTAEVGLESVASGEETLAGVCIRSIDENLSLLPLVSAQRDDARSWRDLARAIAELAAHHDLVIVDAGPLSPELRQLAHVLSNEMELGALIVQDNRRASPEQLQSVATRLHEAELWMAGVVQNFAA